MTVTAKGASSVRFGRRRKSGESARERLEVGADRGELYRAHVQEKLASGDDDEAMRQAIGGEFDAIGAMQCDLLVAHGLQPDGTVVDVGCGSGRLALPLSRYLDERGSYLGTDVVPALLDYARTLVGRDDWRFEQAAGLSIPADDASADVVCFFSVFTHLRHEHSYLYLQEAKRVLKPTGRIIVSFLEFAIYSHWAVFQHNVENPDAEKPLDQFLSRDALASFAHHLELETVAVLDGDKPTIPLRQPITMENGTAYTDLGALGQSIAVFGLPERAGRLEA